MKNLFRVLAILVMASLSAPASKAQAGDYTSKVLIPWVFTMDGVTYGSFYAGNYRWGVILDNNPGGVAMFQAASTAFSLNKNLQVGCQNCRSFTLAKYPVTGSVQFWVPETVMVSNQ